MAPTNEKVSTYVPDDVLFSILSKLPLKSVKRFTCVRKSWTLLFENPSFMKMFYKNMISKSHSLYDGASLILNHFDITDREWKLHLLSGESFESKVQLNWPHPFDRNYGGPHILGSAINGTLCVFNYENQSTIVLWNPTTEQFHRVPINRARLYYEYEPHYTIHGFGYDHVRDDYKIILYVTYIGGLEDYDQGIPSGPFWDIYSLKKNSWKKLYVDMRKGYMSSVGCSVYLNGVCHWWGKQWRGQSVHETYVVSFNLHTEVPVMTILPSDLHDLEGADRHLTVLNGFVAMISSYQKTASSTFHISIALLVEPGVNESWIKLFDLGPFSGIMHPIGAGTKGDVFFKKDDDELVCIDLTTGVIESIGVKAEIYCAQVVIYKKNIRRIKGMDN
jgi:molecular chaperone HtpG